MTVPMSTEEAPPPPPPSLAEQLRGMEPGATLFFDQDQHSMTVVRSTLTRVKGKDRKFTSRPEGTGTRVWRLS